MQVARWFARLTLIASAAFLTAFGASIMFLATGGAMLGMVNGFEHDSDLVGFAETGARFGLMGAKLCGPIAAAFAIPILWRSDLRMSVPVTALGTVAAAAACGLLLLAASWAGIIIAAFLTFFAGVLAMLLCRMKWRLEPAVRLDAPTGAAPQA